MLCGLRRSGHYIFDHEASAEEKKRILGDTVQEKARDLLQADVDSQISGFKRGGLMGLSRQVTTAFTKGARRVEVSCRILQPTQMKSEAYHADSQLKSVHVASCAS